MKCPFFVLANDDRNAKKKGYTFQVHQPKWHFEDTPKPGHTGIFYREIHVRTCKACHMDLYCVGHKKTLQYPNIAMENGPIWRCISYWKIGGIFQPAMLVYQKVSHISFTHPTSLLTHGWVFWNPKGGEVVVSFSPNPVTTQPQFGTVRYVKIEFFLWTQSSSPGKRFGLMSHLSSVFPILIPFYNNGKHHQDVRFANGVPTVRICGWIFFCHSEPVKHGEVFFQEPKGQKK